MSVDLESQLAALGSAWEAALVDVEVDEVVSGAGDAEGPSGAVGRRSTAWVLAAAAALILTLVVSLVALRRDEPTRPIDQPGTTPVPTTVLPATTVTNTAPDTVPATTAGATAGGSEPQIWPAFVATGGMPGRCLYCSGVVVPGGRVLVAGWYGYSEPIGPFWYDPATEVFTPVEIGGRAPFTSGAVGLVDGRIALYGPDTIDLLDPETGMIESVTTTLRDIGDIVTSPDGTATVVDGTGLAELDLATLTTGTTRPSGILLSPLELRGARLVDGSVLVTGRRSETGEYVVTLFRPGSDTPEPVPGLDGVSRVAAMVTLGDGRLLVSGVVEGDAAGDALFVSGAGTPAMFERVGTASGTIDLFGLLPDGRVLVVTHDDGGPGSQLFDPDSGDLVDGPKPGRARPDGTAVTLSDGRVLLLGGSRQLEADEPAELFSPTPFDRADDCCTTVPQQVSFYLEVPRRPDEPDTAIQPVVVVPPGGLDGATGVSYSWGGYQVPGTAGGGDVDVPAECATGCEIEIPLRFAAAGPEGGGSLGVWVGITFEGSPPDAASEISVDFRSESCLPEARCVVDG